MANRYLLFISLTAFLGCQNKSDVNRVKYDGYYIQGKFTVKEKDTILDGAVDYYDSLGHLIFADNYKNGVLDGANHEFYTNGSIKQTINYRCGIEQGIVTDYDSTGKKLFSSCYYFGLRAGPQINYYNDLPSFYRFGNLEDFTLYTCKYVNDTTIIENGNLFNCLARNVKADGVLKVDLFLYIVEPPHKFITYKLFDKNITSGDSILVAKFDGSNGFYCDTQINKLPANHKYFFTVEAYYPRQKKLFHNILNEDNRELYIPPTDSIN